jgi:hypothetical protein
VDSMFILAGLMRTGVTPAVRVLRIWPTFRLSR